MSGTLRDLTAGFSSEGSYTPPNLFAGEQDIVTMSLPLTASTAVTLYQVLALNAAGTLVVLDPAGTGGTATNAIAIGIAVEAAASSGTVRNIPIYVGGNFNHAALGWPAASSARRHHQPPVRL